MHDKKLAGKIERNHEFRRRLEQVHLPGRHDPKLKATADEVEIGEGWRIMVSTCAGATALNAAKDLQDYLQTSMNVPVLVRVGKLSLASTATPRSIMLATADDLPELGKGLTRPRSYRIVCSRNNIIICGFDERGAAQGSYYLEDLMNLREAPFLKVSDIVREPVFSPRMVHSGWGLDQFPDAHLNAMAHYGFDSILVFTRGVDHTSIGYLDFNNLVDRAGRYGLDVYFYSALRSTKHPDEPDAAQYYENTYGALFKACPRAKGVVLVGESVEFPSKDERTTRKLYDAPAENGLPPTKPSPGWWPCRDYPQWVTMVRNSVHKYNPTAEIVFWTYNWGWAPEKDRLALIKSLPRDITLLVTFEMFEKMRHEKATLNCVDYTISFEGPGRYFATEAKEARRRNIRLYTMSNTGGLTWDIGVIPYEPVPMQWTRRHQALLLANKKWGLSGLMESHHYGWWPSFVSELAKWAFWKPSPPAGELMAEIAGRDYGKKAAPLVIAAWERWSAAIRCYIPTNEDQYGPFRVGPSYPFIFHPNLSRQFASKKIAMPAAWHAKFGSGIVLTPYNPLENSQQSAGSMRIDVEIRSLEKMLALWAKGIANLEKALPLMPAAKQPAGENLVNLGRFIRNCIRTAINTKKWWKLNQQLVGANNQAIILRLLKEIEALARKEIVNASETIPLVEKDSRLGWEPSMDYMTDAEHLRWKIAQVQAVIDHELPEYLNIVKL